MEELINNDQDACPSARGRICPQTPELPRKGGDVTVLDAAFQ